MNVERIIFSSFHASVERSAKVCTDAKVVGDLEFANKLWGLKHQTPFEHNTFILLPEAQEYDEVLEYIRWANHVGGYQPAFRLTLWGIIGSFRAFANLKPFRNCSVEEMLSLIAPYSGDGARITYLVTTNIGVAREFLRHRELSFTERSTRYTKSQELFPTKAHHAMTDIFNRALENRELMIEEGCSRDNYRELLPLCTKTVFYATGFKDQWVNFISLRAQKSAHPAIRSLAEQIKYDLCL